MRVACWLVTGHFGRSTYLLPLDLIHHLIVRVPCQMSNIVMFQMLPTEVRFVTAVTAAGSVKFFASGVNFSKNTHFLCFYH